MPMPPPRNAPAPTSIASGAIAVRPIDRLAVPFISVALLAIGVALIATHRIPSPGFRRILRAHFRAPFKGRIGAAAPESGHCYRADLPPELLSDSESASRLRLFEDGREIGPGHAPHDDIRARGGGRYSHWGPTLYFSASDNTDPRRNGRIYEVAEVRA